MPRCFQFLTSSFRPVISGYLLRYGPGPRLFIGEREGRLAAHRRNAAGLLGLSRASGPADRRVVAHLILRCRPGPAHAGSNGGDNGRHVNRENRELACDELASSSPYLESSLSPAPESTPRIKVKRQGEPRLPVRSPARRPSRPGRPSQLQAIMFQAARARARGYRNTTTFACIIYLIGAPIGDLFGAGAST